MRSMALFYVKHYSTAICVLGIFIACFGVYNSHYLLEQYIAITNGTYQTSEFSIALCIVCHGSAIFEDNLPAQILLARLCGQSCAARQDSERISECTSGSNCDRLTHNFLVLSFSTDIHGEIAHSYNLFQIIPYVLVLAGGIIGVNVFVVLITGIISGIVIMLVMGEVTLETLLLNMGSGASGMFETCMVAVLVSVMCSLIKEYGGFDALLNGIRRLFKGKKGGQFGMGLLVGTMDIATANNTVAIVMANPIAKEMSEDYDITPRKAASLLDTFSCIFQGIIPYGAQMLVAISAVSELGYNITAFQILPKLFYPMFLFVSSLIWIYVIPEGKNKNKA